jgi:hypothetical protein
MEHRAPAQFVIAPALCTVRRFARCAPRSCARSRQSVEGVRSRTRSRTPVEDVVTRHLMGDVFPPDDVRQRLRDLGPKSVALRPVPIHHQRLLADDSSGNRVRWPMTDGRSGRLNVEPGKVMAPERPCRRTQWTASVRVWGFGLGKEVLGPVHKSTPTTRVSGSLLAASYPKRRPRRPRVEAGRLWRPWQDRGTLHSVTAEVFRGPSVSAASRGPHSRLQG